MAELKTKQTDRGVEEFLNEISDEKTRNDCYTVLKLMQKVTGEKPKMWGSSIVGFGNYHYKYESGREGDWFLVGFSPRKQNLTLYLMYGLERLENLLKKLGKYKTGKSCLYIKSLADIDQSVLKELIKQSVDSIRKRY
jgi:hypothetical protein